MNLIERVYPVRKQTLAQEAALAYAGKIRANHDSGLNALVSGEFRPFRGFPLALLENTFAFSLVLDEESQETIGKRVIEPLSELAESFGIPMLFAGLGDHLSHVSVDAFKLSDIPDADKEKVASIINSSKSHASPLKQILARLRFHFNTLVVGPNIYICEGDFNDEQGAPFRSRQIIRKIMERVHSEYPSIDPLYPRYDDLFHSNVARITSTDSIPEEFITQAYSTVGADIKENPIEVRSDELFVGRWIDFHHRFPTLIAE